MAISMAGGTASSGSSQKRPSSSQNSSKGTSSASGSSGSSSSSSGGGKVTGSASSEKVTFDPNFDYAAAIKQTSDPKERARLLAERQAKINALGLEGKVGSNAIVAGWFPDDFKADEDGLYFDSRFESLDVSGLYEAAAQARLEAFENARKQIANNLASQLTDIDSAYQAGMTQTEVNARRSALANEEKLAALGLSSGAAYEAPTSGYTETSRVQSDNAYRADLNALGEARLSARASAQQAAADSEAALTTGYLNDTASAALAQAQSEIAQYNADRDYSISLAGLTGYINGGATLAAQKYQTDSALAWAEQQQSANQTAYEQALNRWKTYGYVLPADAGILGVAAGVSTADERYRQAQLALSQAKLK